jgi:2-polyprenyl-3-methyl-5-hydroxy-6-metoxy-1,4-benzoquinol methylase
MENNVIKLTPVNKCPICFCKNRNLVRKKETFKLYQCEKCKIVYLHEIPCNIDDIYNKTNLITYSQYYKLSETLDKKIFKSRLNTIKNITKATSKDSILDIGCSVGCFLNVARQMGWNQILGIDPIKESIDECTNKNIPVISNFFDKKIADQKRDQFCIVHLGDVIEHVQNPNEILKNIKTVLKPKGFVAIVTPNYDSLIAKIFQVKPYEHLTYFNEESLFYLLKQNDFKVVYSSKITRERSLKSLAFGHAITSDFGKTLVNFLIWIKAENLINFFIKNFVKDELFVIAKKQ